MKNSENTIATIFHKAFIDVTKRVANLDIIEETPNNNEIQDLYSGIVITDGVYKSVLICTMQESVMNEISRVMNNGRKVDVEEAEIYATEYLNIVCGNALTQINNLVGKASRFTVPVIMRGPYEKNNKAKYDHMLEFSYSSWFGNIRVNMEYTFSSS